MGSICHSSVVSTAQSARDSDANANMDFSSQHDVSATWKLSEKMYPEGVNSTYTTYYQMQHILRGVLAERQRVRAEKSFEAVSYCDLAQNLEIVQF